MSPTSPQPPLVPAEFISAAARLHDLRDRVVRQTEADLADLVKGKVFSTADTVFGRHTTLAEFSQIYGFPTLTIDAWTALAPKAAAAEQALRTARGDPKVRIHKGAPLFNVGVCHFANGDLENGFKFLTETGNEDVANGTSDGLAVRLGDHPLSRQILIDPIVAAFSASWSKNYLAITGCKFDDAELRELVKYTAQRPMDAIQLVAALQRFLKAKSSPQNDWARYARIRALADLVIVVESTLRWKHRPIDGELAVQLGELLRGQSDYLSVFGTFNGDFGTAFPANSPTKKTAAAVDWCINKTIVYLNSGEPQKKNGGAACFLTLRLRNSLLHVLEDRINIFADEAKCTEVFSVALATLRLAKLGSEGKL
jgi:hypothetical protein